MKKIVIMFAAVWLVLNQSDARAALSMTLAPANVARGTQSSLDGALTNTGASNTLFLNGIRVVLNGSASNSVRVNTNAFFANVPGLLLPDEIYTGGVIEVQLSELAPAGDYEGSITLQGGSDIFATDDLASSTFLIASPTVSVAATDPAASEFGPEPGSFTIARTGATNADLTVAFAISGNATNGIAYSLLSPSVTIPAGTNAAPVVIVPIADHVAQGDRTVTLTLAPAVSYNLTSHTTATVTIHDQPYDEWRRQKFGAAANDPLAADQADWDADGIQNVLEYALNLDPTIPDSHPLPEPRIVDDHFTWSYVPNTNALDVALVVEASSNLVEWSSADVEPVIVPNPDPPARITVRCRNPVSLADRAFLRLRASRVQP